jgi:dephospho-CoA kinase
MPFVVSLTGGIGSGKTTVANAFAALGALIVDTDVIARALTASGQPATNEIARRFGSEYLTSTGALDRDRMRALVFSNPEAKKVLESLLHPLIQRESERQILASTAPYVIVVIPLLFESGRKRDASRPVLVVDCDAETQVGRVMNRSNLSRQQVLAIMANQASREERLRGADDVIRNDGDLEALNRQVRDLHGKYLDLAAKA